MEAVVQTVTDNIFLRKFHALELQSWFTANFPDSFSIEIYKGDNVYVSRNKAALVWSHEKQMAGHGGYYKLKYPAQYSIASNGAEFHLYTGSENSYLYLVVYDMENTMHIVDFGYKRGEVERNYALELSTLLTSKANLFL